MDYMNNNLPNKQMQNLLNLAFKKAKNECFNELEFEVKQLSYDEKVKLFQVLVEELRGDK